MILCREKGKRANLKTGVSRKRNTPKFPENKHFLHFYTHVSVSGGKRCLFFGNFEVLCFLETPVLRFALVCCPYEEMYKRILSQHTFTDNDIVTNKMFWNFVRPFLINKGSLNSCEIMVRK